MSSTVEELIGEEEFRLGEPTTTAVLVKDRDEDQLSSENGIKAVTEARQISIDDNSQKSFTPNLSNKPEACSTAHNSSEKVQSSSESEILAPPNEGQAEEATRSFPSPCEGSGGDSLGTELSTNDAATLQATAQQTTSKAEAQDDLAATALNREVSQEVGLYLNESAPVMDDKIGTSTSSSDVSLLPHRRDSMYVNFHFPPSPSSVELNTPETESPMRKTRRLRRRTSLLQELQNSHLSSHDLQTSPQSMCNLDQSITASGMYMQLVINMY